MLRYRPNVAALILNSEGRLLVCERMNQDGSWQFPQGGINKGESALEALIREVEEEVNLTPKHYDVLEYREGYKYEFPPEKGKNGYDGQVQTYFLCRLKEDSPEPDVEVEGKEFQNYKWIKTKKFKRMWLPEFKQKTYEQVLWDFFGKKLKEQKIAK